MSHTAEDDHASASLKRKRCLQVLFSCTFIIAFFQKKKQCFFIFFCFFWRGAGTQFPATASAIFSAILRITGTTTEFPACLYRRVSDSSSGRTKLSGNPWSRKHSRGVSFLIPSSARMIGTLWPPVPVWKVASIAQKCKILTFPSDGWSIFRQLSHGVPVLFASWLVP